MLFLEFVSAVFGWIYTFSWSASFYSQPLLSWRRKSTSGTTVDFPLINTFGFLAYLTSNFALYYSPLIRSQYAQRNHGLQPTVAFNDIVFALHAATLSLITYTQYAFPAVWSFERAPGTTPSRLILGVISGSILAILIIATVVLTGDAGTVSGGDGGGDTFDSKTQWAQLDIIYTVSYVKLLVTLVKYLPQLRYNARNRSTRGWSIGQVLLDFSGGLLSIAQQGVDSFLQRDWSGISGNPVKFALGNVSMLYDLGFMTQHYVLYPDVEGRKRCARGRKNGEQGVGEEEEEGRGLLERGQGGQGRRED